MPLTQQLPTQQIQVVRTNQHHDHLVTQQLKATVQLIEGTINNNNNNNLNNTTSINIDDNTANNNINNNINNININQLNTNNKIEEHDYNNHDTEHKIHKTSSSCSSLIGVDNNNLPQFSPQIQINKFKSITNPSHHNNNNTQNNMQNNRDVVEMLNGSEISSMVVDKSILLSDKAPTPFTSSSSSTTQDTVDSSMKMSTDLTDPITVVKSNQCLTTSSSSVNKSANLSVANNIANAFINLSTFNSPTVGAGNVNNNNSSSGSSPSGSGTTTSNTKNVNVIVTQPISQHFVKTLSFATSRGGIFVPNVIATNLSPQFTVHHHQYGIHGASGPAPNVTVNPNGNFNSNSSAVVRPGTSNHFRLLFQQSPNINFNIVGNQNASANATGTNQSPILEASLQTLSKVTQGKIISNSKINTTNRIIPSTVINSKTTNAPALVPTQSVTKLISNGDNCGPMVTSVTSPKSSGEQGSNDQHIRVLTPSEIMRTLPSLPPQDHNICFNSTNVIISDKSNVAVDNNNKILVKTSTTPTQQSSSAQTIIAQTVSQSQPLSASNNSPLITNNTIINTNLFCNSSTNSSPITTTTTTSDTFISSNITNSTTSSSVLAQQMVRGYKTYTKKIYIIFAVFYFSFGFNFVITF